MARPGPLQEARAAYSSHRERISGRRQGGRGHGGQECGHCRRRYPQ
jgi:hypothetical protein